MSDKSKKNVYRKTMGFNHKDTNTSTEYFANTLKGSAAEINYVSHAIYRPWDKDKFKGAKDGLNKTFLSARGNKSAHGLNSYAVPNARRKLVKGT